MKSAISTQRARHWRTPARLGAAFGLALGVAAWPASAAHAQTGSVTGVVTNATSGETIPGVQVSLVGTGIGTLTNNVGRFLLENVPTGTQQLRAELIGYGTVTQEVSIVAGQSVTASLEIRAEAIPLEGVVVTGTAGQARRREVGNSIAQINAAALENVPIANVTQMIQGRAAGATIMDNTGQVGAATTIRLRGNNSVTQGNTPLIYVDGVRINNRASSSFDEAYQSTTGFSDINPADVERVEVIKGAAATTLYGTEASAGVIQIFTKRGASGSPSWSLSVDQGINYMGHVGPDESINPTGLGLNRCDTDLDSRFPSDPTCPSNGSWFQNGHVQTYNLSVRGGGDQINYYVSGLLGNEEGVVGQQGQEQWAIRGNFGFTPIENLTFTFNNAYSHKDITWIPDGDNAEGFVLNVLRGDNDYTQSAGYGDGNVFDMSINSLTDHFTTGMNVLWVPTENFSHRLNVGLDYNKTDYREERPWGFWRVPLGDREVDTEWIRKLTLDYSGTWSAQVATDLRSTFSWGGQLFDDYRSRINGFGLDFAGPGDKDVGSGAITSASETRVSVTNGGFFVQEMIGWKDKLFLTGGVRVDGHSAFGDDFGLAPYPKASVAYLISEESFFPGTFSTLKLRGAYGESGRAPGVFDAVQTWDAVSGDEAQPGVTPLTLGNPDLGPERSTEIEAGFEGAAFDNRLSFEYTYFKQKTTDALIAVQQRPSSGFVLSQLENVGEIENKGHEAFVSVNVIRAEGLNWDVGVQYSTNESKVLDLGGLESIPLGWRNYARLGEPLPTFCENVVQNPDEVGVVPIMDEECLGVTYPTQTWGINTTLTIGQRFTIDALGEGQGGHVISAGPAYQNVRRSVWPECYAIQDQIAAGNTANLTARDRALCDTRYTTYGMWTRPADFFKLRSVAAAYRIPGSWLPGAIRSATVRVQARNLFTITDYPGLDPEAFQDGSSDELYRQEYYNLPPLRSLLLSFKVDF